LPAFCLCKDAPVYEGIVGAYAQRMPTSQAQAACYAASLFLSRALLLPLLVGCTASHESVGGKDAGGEAAATVAESACDPLAAKAITLGNVVGVGKDADGTLYVDSANGVFVSGGGKLIRQHVIGTGSNGANEFQFMFEPPDGNESSARNLLVDTAGTIATAMALGPANSKAFLGQSDAGVTPLALVDAATVSGLAVVNTPNGIEYVADVANGDILMATLPMNGDTMSEDGGLSIFYGPTGDVAERTVTDFGQTLSGNGMVTFLVDGTPYVLAFGTVQSPDAGPLGIFTLEGLTPQGGAQIGVRLRSPTPTAVPIGLTFTCLP